MTVKEFVEILKKPSEISQKQASQLDEIVLEYPYFQSARVLQLKILHSLEDYRYSKALKLAAVHVSDRTVLYDFINSEEIIPDKNSLKSDFEELKQKHSLKNNNTANSPKISYLENEPRDFLAKIEHPFGEPIFRNDMVNYQELADFFVPKKEEETPKKNINAISDWLEGIADNTAKNEYKDDKIAKKFELIDKFLETNPKIEPSKDYVSNINLANEVKTDPQQLMTETLAQVYVNQRKYKQAIQAYEILILKNPKKSAYFAAQIQKIKNLQQNN